MKISFLKKENNQHVLICKRKDGSLTWMNADEFFLRHDFFHYAVETILQLKSAFYGMIAGGVFITDFELPKNKRTIKLTGEALLAEYIVNLVMVEAKEGKIKDFNIKLNESLKANKENLKNILISNEQLDSIHTTYKSLMQQWNKLHTGETMILNFEE